MKDKFKFALVGCGRISKKHIESLLSIPEAELVAVCDIHEERARQVGERYNLKYFYSYDEMLQNVEVDVVNILTPSGLHAKYTIDIARK